jgi:hypothetical protein
MDPSQTKLLATNLNEKALIKVKISHVATHLPGITLYPPLLKTLLAHPPQIISTRHN